MEMVKLTSLNCWADENSILPCDETGKPKMDEAILYDNLSPEWFNLLSIDDKVTISKLINNNKNNN